MFKTIKYLMLSVLVGGCATTQNSTAPSLTPTLSVKDFQPLTIGTTWKYELTLLGAARAVDISLVKQEGQFTLDSTGAKFAIDQFGLRDDKRYLLRNPLTVGTSWTNVVSVSSIERYQILSAGQPCQEAGQQFDSCVVVLSRNTILEDKALENELTFAKGVGIVRVNTVLVDKGQRIPQSSLVLLRFELGEPSRAVAPVGGKQ
jgi:hypothetical protein